MRDPDVPAAIDVDAHDRTEDPAVGQGLRPGGIDGENRRGNLFLHRPGVRKSTDARRAERNRQRTRAKKVSAFHGVAA
jgi:hypothetical protein